MDIARGAGGGRTRQISELVIGGEFNDRTFIYVVSRGKEADRMLVWCRGRMGKVIFGWGLIAPFSSRDGEHRAELRGDIPGCVGLYVEFGLQRAQKENFLTS